MTLMVVMLTVVMLMVMVLMMMMTMMMVEVVKMFGRDRRRGRGYRATRIGFVVG